MIELAHHPWCGHGDSKPLTWDYAKRIRRTIQWDSAMAVITCEKGHSLLLSSQIHTLSNNGVVSPSWVCRHPDCTWHVHLRLVGWNPNHEYEYIEKA